MIMNTEAATPRLVKLKELCKACGISENIALKFVRDGTFKQHKLGYKLALYDLHECVAALKQRAADRQGKIQKSNVVEA